jgi:hypothetical protein
MAKATTKTNESDLDLEGRLSHKLGQAEGLASLINEATHAGHYDPKRMTNVCGLLEEVLEEVRTASDELAERWRALRPAAAGALPAARKRPKAVKEPKPAKPHWKTLQKQQREASANGTGEMQSQDFGGGQ